MKYLLITFCLFLFACGSQDDFIQPEKKALVQSVYASASVTPKNSYSVNSSVSGIIERLIVQVGDTVGVGDAIAKISDDKAVQSEESARLNLELAKEQFDSKQGVLQQIQQNIERLQLQLENDSINYLRQKRLWEQNIGSKIEYETKKLQYELTKKQLKSQVEDYQLKKKELKTQYKLAANQWESNLLNKSDFLIRSKLSGVVYELMKENGEWVNMQESIALIGSSDWFILELKIDERDIARIELGQKVYVSLNAYPDEVFEAKVSKVHPKMNASTQTFLVEAEFKNFPKQLYMGMSGEANIVIHVSEEKWVIPLEALVNKNQINTPNGLQELELGKRNLVEVEVVDGVDENTKILLPTE